MRAMLTAGALALALTAACSASTAATAAPAPPRPVPAAPAGWQNDGSCQTSNEFCQMVVKLHHPGETRLHLEDSVKAEVSAIAVCHKGSRTRQKSREFTFTVGGSPHRIVPHNWPGGSARRCDFTFRARQLGQGLLLYWITDEKH